MELLYWLLPRLFVIAIAIGIAGLFISTFHRALRDEDRPHDITEDYIKLWDDEVGGYMWFKRSKPKAGYIPWDERNIEDD